MARRKPARAEEEHEGGGGGGHGGGGAGRWLVSYADFVTLLFVVFVVLFSMARVDLSKYEGLAKSLSSALGPNVPPLPTQAPPGQAMPVTGPQEPPPFVGPEVPDFAAPIVSPPEQPKAEPKQQPEPTPSPKQADTPAPRNPEPASPPKEADSMSVLEQAFRDLPGVRTGLIKVALEERGLVLTIAGSVLFEPGQASLKPDARAHLAQVAGQLRDVVLPIMVEGTADAKVQQGQSPWDLAALRAGAVVRYLVEEQGMPADRFITIGYGSAPSDRVTIVVLRKRE
jgi:chemotaxis protein MotB